MFKVKWINFTGQQQERIFTQRAAEQFIKGLKVSRLKVVSVQEVRP